MSSLGTYVPSDSGRPAAAPVMSQVVGTRMRPVPQKLSGLPNIASSEETKRQELPGLYNITMSRQDTSAG